MSHYFAAGVTFLFYFILLDLFQFHFHFQSKKEYFLSRVTLNLWSLPRRPTLPTPVQKQSLCHISRSLRTTFIMQTHKDTHSRPIAIRGVTTKWQPPVWIVSYRSNCAPLACQWSIQQPHESCLSPHQDVGWFRQSFRGCTTGSLFPASWTSSR